MITDPILEQKLSVAQGGLDEVKAYVRTQADKLAALPPTPPPPPVLMIAGFPNAPNLPTLSDQPFESDTDARGWAARGQYAIAYDPSAPKSPGNVLQFIYPTGFAGGSAPGKVYIGLNGKRTVYAGFWTKVSAGWQGHNSNVNKWAHLFMNGSSGEMYVGFYGTPGGPYEVRTCLEFRNGDTRDWLKPNMNISAAQVSIGTWNLVEWFIDYTTKRLGCWLNGILVLDYRDVQYPTDTPAEFQLSPTWGGMGDVKQHVDAIAFDHALIKAV